MKQIAVVTLSLMALMACNHSVSKEQIDVRTNVGSLKLTDKVKQGLEKYFSQFKEAGDLYYVVHLMPICADSMEVCMDVYNDLESLEKRFAILAIDTASFGKYYVCMKNEMGIIESKLSFDTLETETGMLHACSGKLIVFDNDSVIFKNCITHPVCSGCGEVRSIKF